MKDAYEKDESSYDKTGLRVRRNFVKEDETALKKVEDALALPMMVTSGFESGSKQTQEMEEGY